MINHHRRQCGRLLYPAQHLYSSRHFATKYSGRVVVEADNGRKFAVEVDAPNLNMDVRGYPLPRRDLICKVTKLLKSPSSASPDPFSDLSEYLQSLSLTLTTSEASEILKSLKSPRTALEFFRFCPSAIPKFRHDAFTYNRILLILSKSSSSENRSDAVRRIIDEMEKSGMQGNISTINILIGICGKGEIGVDELEKCLGLLKKWDLMLNNYTYKCLLQAYLRLHCSSKAYQVYLSMRRRGYKLDIFAYNMLLDSLVKDEKTLTLWIPTFKRRNTTISFVPMAAPMLARYGWIRDPIPGPYEGGHEPLFTDLAYHPEGETIRQYCNYVHDLCIFASHDAHTYPELSNPLSICGEVLRGLPDEHPWMDIKAEYEDIVIVDWWDRVRPNENKYRHLNGVYAINTSMLRQRLWEIEQEYQMEQAAAAEEEDLGEDDSDTENEEEFIEANIDVDEAVQLFQEEAQAAAEIEEEDDEDDDPIEIEPDEIEAPEAAIIADEIDIDPEEIADIFPSDDDEP